MTLGGAIMIRNGERFDYCYKEAIECLQELCDQVVILDAGSLDGTEEVVRQYEDQNTIVINLIPDEWDKHMGRERLSYFQNLAVPFLETDYYFLLQGDEIIHEKSFPFIRQAIEVGDEAFVCKRINLWRDCDSYINVPANRQPCSTHVIRLAKTNCLSYDDGESIRAFGNSKFVNDIRIYHMGFVRRRDVMIDKIINMQKNVFQIESDPKLKGMKEFDWSAWFNESELSLIEEELPKFIKEWASSRP